MEIRAIARKGSNLLILNGGEGGIRTRPSQTESVSCRKHIPRDAKNPMIARAHRPISPDEHRGKCLFFGSEALGLGADEEPSIY